MLALFFFSSVFVVEKFEKCKQMGPLTNKKFDDDDDDEWMNKWISICVIIAQVLATDITFLKKDPITIIIIIIIILTEALLKNSIKKNNKTL